MIFQSIKYYQNEVIKVIICTIFNIIFFKFFVINFILSYYYSNRVIYIFTLIDVLCGDSNSIY